MGDYTLLCGDSIAMLRTLPAGSVQCVATSPPYWNLRDYGVSGQIGLEPSLAGYLGALVSVFAAVHRVLRDDGVAFVNIGDSYAASSTSGPQGATGDRATRTFTAAGLPPKTGAGLKPKDLCMVPARLAIALQEWGWYLRSAITWCKPNPMPESVTDRPTSATEMVYLLAKNPTYFYDADAIREDAVKGSAAAGARNWRPLIVGNQRITAGQTEQAAQSGRNRRNWWVIPSQPFPEAHFACYPEALVEPCILAGSSPRACEHCGAPWARVTDRAFTPQQDVSAVLGIRGNGHQKPMDESNGWQGFPRGTTSHNTKGWSPTCACPNEGTGRCLVLDPFAGSGTTGVVALRHGRDFVGVDLNPEYIALARRRIEASLHASNVLAGPKVRAVEGQQPLFPEMDSPPEPVRDKQGASGLSTYVGFNARWKEKHG